MSVSFMSVKFVTKLACSVDRVFQFLTNLRRTVLDSQAYF